MAVPTFRLEVLATFFFSIALACVEGGVVAVLAKQTYSGQIPERQLYFAVALVGAASEIANIVSFWWTQRAKGRPKVPYINLLQAALIACVGLIAFVPPTGFGLWLLVALVMLARTFWSGMITLRPTLWRANYPREVRASAIGRFSTVQVLVVAAMGVLIGQNMDADPSSFRVIFPIAATFAIISIQLYSRVRVRREDALLKAERADGSSAPSSLAPWRGPIVVWNVLRRDPFYARFMLWMFVMGFGNLMLTPIVVISLKDKFELGYLHSILIASSIPAVVTSVAIPLWAKLLDRAHVVRFRAIHGWVFVLSTGTILLAAATTSTPLMFVGAILQGIGFGGGALAWNLGHVDFAPPPQTSQYMATHVTLNGLRGLIAPFVAAGIYERVAALGTFRFLGNTYQSKPLADVAAFAIATLLTIIGAAGFVHLRFQMGKLADKVKRS